MKGELTPTERLLVEILTHAEGLVSRTEMCKKMYPYIPKETAIHNVRVVVHRVRNKRPDLGLRTIAGEGWMLSATRCPTCGGEGWIRAKSP